MLWNSNGVTHLTLIEDAANKYRYMFQRTMAISHTSSELCLTVSHVERGVSFFSRVQGERNIEILNFYLRSFIARYNSDPVKTCLSNWYIFYYATRKMKTSISPNKKKNLNKLKAVWSFSSKILKTLHMYMCIYTV